MGLENATRLKQPTVADLGSAARQGIHEVRLLLDPLLPTLYTFLSRRSQDREEAEDLLVDTLVLARGTALARPTPAPLRAWLLQLGERILRSRVEQEPLLQAGLLPNWVVPEVTLPPPLVTALRRLPSEARQALGMHYGDGLSVELIGEVLGSRSPDRLLDQALTAVQRSLTKDDERVLPSMVGNWLSCLHAATSLSSGAEIHVWRRYEEADKEFVPGPPLPSIPLWLRPALGGAAAMLLFLAAWVWFLGRPPQAPIAEVAPQATARVAGDIPSVTPAPYSQIPLAIRPPLSAAEARGRGGIGGFGRRHEGTLYYLEQAGNRGVRLMKTEVEPSIPGGRPRRETLLSLPGKVLQYAVSPTDSRVAFTSGNNLWLRSDGMTHKLSRETPGQAGGSARVPRSLIRSLAWHPNGDRIAVATLRLADKPDGQITTRIESLRLPGLQRTSLISLPSAAPVHSLTYSPSGRYLLIVTPLEVRVLDTERGNQVIDLPQDVAQAYWSSDIDQGRLLWIAAAGASGKPTAFGTVSPDGRALKLLGKATRVSWHPDGRSIIAARAAPEGGSEFWLHNVRNGDQEQLGEIASMDLSAIEVAFGPDGRHLVYADEDGIHLAHLNSSRTENITETSGKVHSLRWHPVSGDLTTPRQPGR